MLLRLEAFDLKQRLKAHADAVATARRDEPAYQRMFEVAARAREEWKALAAGQPELLALVGKVEAAHFSRSRSQREGCEATTAAALAKAVGALPAKTFAGMLDKRFDPTAGVAAAAGPTLVADPAVNLAATAFALCNNDGTARFLATALETTPGNRGPRTLAFTRLLAEKLQLDDVDARISWPSTDRPYRGGGSGMISAGGVIASTTVDGELVIVKFARMPVKRQECVESHTTSQIYKIHSDGRVEYEQVCDRMDTVIHDDQWMDFSVAKKYLPLLKKGVRISVIEPPQGSDTGKEVIVTWPNGKADVPGWMLGATLR
jgi:hypothetical protein